MGFPSAAHAWRPGTYPGSPDRMHAAGFSVNTRDRNDVVAFWHAVYQASEGYETRVNWSGNYTGNNGTVSGPFLDDVERRLNYFRAMCGLDANATVNSGSTILIDLADLFKPGASISKSVSAQSAALMLIRNFNPTTGMNPALTHDPPANLIGWSPAAWNAAANGNFAFGVYGPGAITEYMIEALTNNSATSPWNSLVGHRRWCLYPVASDYATGDQPGSGATRPPTNVFYVSQKPTELLEIPVPGFVSYPAAGFFPAPVNSPYWSLSRKGADFTFASVKMTDSGGRAVPISSIKRNNSYGDPAIIWEVSPAAAARSVYNDTTFQVQITGIVGLGVPASYSYSVTLINPDRLTANPQMAGAGSVAPNSAGTFTFSPPAGAEGLQVVASRKVSTAWAENAEIPGKSKVIDGTAENYPLMVKTSTFAGFGGVSGASAFRLTFPNSYDLIKRGVPEQSFELDRDIIANAKASLTFQYRRGYMTKTSTLAVESSTDGGVSWKALGAPIKGLSDTRFDLSVSSSTRPLPKSTAPVKIRFRYFTTGGSIYTHEAAPNSPTGIFIDEIKTVNCGWLEAKKVNTLSATANRFVFNSSTAGAKLVAGSQWHLGLRTKLGGKWFPLMTAKIVTVSGP